MSPSYIPTQADVLRARVRSFGIEEADIKYDDITFNVVYADSLGRKWIHMFDSVTVVIFVVGLQK